MIDLTGHKAFDASQVLSNLMGYSANALSTLSDILKLTGHSASETAQAVDSASGIIGTVNKGVEIAQFASEIVPDDVYSAYRSFKDDAGHEPNQVELNEYMNAGFGIEYQHIFFLQKTADAAWLIGGNPIVEFFFPIKKGLTKQNDSGFARWYSSVYSPQAGDNSYSNQWQYDGSYYGILNWSKLPSQGK
jgi:hypothetical protein